MVIPGLWLPGTALLPWLLPRWMAAWRERDPRPWLLLIWVVMVVLFFSMSPGKRGLYVFPALPAFALAAAPVLIEIWRRRAVQWVGFGLALLLGAVAAAAYLYASVFDPARITELQQQYGVISLAPLAVIALAIGVAAIVIGPRRGLLAWSVATGVVLTIQGFWINPMIDDSRSDRRLARRIETLIPGDVELGLVAYPEGLLLQLRRSTTNFGHRRSRMREGDQELADALLWLNERPGRSLLLDGQYRRTSCLADVPAMALRSGEDPDWYVLGGPASHSCGLQGRASAARVYRPPGV
jgi:4-amino-4-deoxy-L-arabinose transferase-like glycosyltransferase